MPYDQFGNFIPPYNNFNQPKPQNTYAFVNGLDGAKQYNIPVNQSMLLMDNTQAVCYLKQANALGHWTLEETNSVARQHGIEFIHCNQYDWNYVMNMIYSDYYGSVSNETSVYVKLAKKFLQDKDAPEGKALKYYLAMKE